MDNASPPDAPIGGTDSVLVQYWHILRKRAGVVAVFTFLLMLTVAIATKLSTPFYAAVAVIEISPKTANVMDTQQVTELVTATSTADLRNYYATQYQIMESRSVISRAIDSLREDHDIDDFDDQKKPINYFRRHLAIEPIVETHLVEIIVEYPDPRKAELFADALAGAYMESNFDRALQSTRDALEWLQDQRAAYKDEKYAAEMKIHDYRTENDLVGTSKAYNGSLQRLKSVQEAWTEAATETTQLQARYNELNRRFGAGQVVSLAQAMSTDDTVLRDLLAHLDKLQQERSRLAVQFLDKAPPMVEVNTEIAAVRDQITQQVSEIIAGEQASLDLARTQEQALLTELELVKDEVEKLDKKLIDLQILETDSARSAEFFQDIDRRVAEVDLNQLMRNNNIRFIDRAVADDDPVRPKLGVNLVMAMVLGLFGGTLLAFGMEYLDTTVKSREDIENFIGVPMLGVVPKVDPIDFKALPREIDRHIFVYARPRSTTAECLRSIRTNVLFRTPQKKVRTLLITSAAPKEGKSFTSSNLASIIAMTGSRVLLLDADLRRPSLHKLFGLPNEQGLSSLLVGETTFDQVLQHSHVPGLDVIVAGPPSPNPGETLSSGAMEQVLSKVSGYDFILIDSPPVNVVADPLVLSGTVDGVLLVVEANQTSRRLVRMAGTRLAEVDAPVVGAIVNKLDLRHAGYGYNYYDNYGYYYTEGEQFPDQKTG